MGRGTEYEPRKDYLILSTIPRTYLTKNLSFLTTYHSFSLPIISLPWPRGDVKPFIGIVVPRVLSKSRVGGCPGGRTQQAARQTIRSSASSSKSSGSNESSTSSVSSAAERGTTNLCNSVDKDETGNQEQQDQFAQCSRVRWHHQPVQ